MGDCIVGLTWNWDIKAILCCSFHFSTPGMTYKIRPYKHTHRSASNFALRRHCSSHLFSPCCQPSVELSLWEAVLFTGVCGYLPAGVGLFLSLTHFFFLLFFFLSSSVLVPAGPFLFISILLFQRAIQRRCSTQNAHTQQAQHCLMGCAPWKKMLLAVLRFRE